MSNLQKATEYLNEVLRVDTSIDTEISRLNKLLEESKMDQDFKNNLSVLFQVLTDEDNDNIKYQKQYYIDLIKYLESKILFWTQLKSGSFDKKLLPLLQETMDDWLNSAWNYMGMESIKEDSEYAKQEFEFLKNMITTLPVKPSIKKTRRAGKKHKK